MKLGRLVLASLAAVVSAAALDPGSARADNLIVPGSRVGSIQIGMTEQDLYRAAGDPATSNDYGQGYIGYSYRVGSDPAGVHLTVGPDRRVNEIVVQTPNFQTVDGLHVGSSQLAVRAALGLPAKSITSHGQSPEVSVWCYPSGLSVGVTFKGVSTLVVKDPNQWSGMCR